MRDSASSSALLALQRPSYLRADRLPANYLVKIPTPNPVLGTRVPGRSFPTRKTLFRTTESCSRPAVFPARCCILVPPPPAIPHTAAPRKASNECPHHPAAV